MHLLNVSRRQEVTCRDQNPTGQVVGGFGAGQLAAVLPWEEDFSHFLYTINVHDTNDLQKLLLESKSFIQFYQWSS